MSSLGRYQGDGVEVPDAGLARRVVVEHAVRSVGPETLTPQEAFGVGVGTAAAVVEHELHCGALGAEAGTHPVRADPRGFSEAPRLGGEVVETLRWVVTQHAANDGAVDAAAVVGATRGPGTAVVVGLSVDSVKQTEGVGGAVIGDGHSNLRGMVGTPP